MTKQTCVSFTASNTVNHRYCGSKPLNEIINDILKVNRGDNFLVFNSVWIEDRKKNSLNTMIL